MHVDVFIPPKDYESKLKIVHAVDRPLDEVSVEQICRGCGISRQTFYRHFDSKYAVATWYSLVCESLCLDEIGRTLTWREGLTRHFSLLERERRAFKLLAGSKERAALMEQMRCHRRDVIIETLREYQRIEPDDVLLYCVRAYTHVEERMAGEWFSDGMPTDPETFAGLLELCVPGPLYEALNTPVRRT